MLEQREVPDLEDVAQVAGVGGGPRIRFVPALVAGSTGELDQGLAAVGVGGPGTSDGAVNSVAATICTRNGTISDTSPPRHSPHAIAASPGREENAVIDCPTGIRGDSAHPVPDRRVVHTTAIAMSSR